MSEPETLHTHNHIQIKWFKSQHPQSNSFHQRMQLQQRHSQFQTHYRYHRTWFTHVWSHRSIHNHFIPHKNKLVMGKIYPNKSHHITNFLQPPPQDFETEVFWLTQRYIIIQPKWKPTNPNPIINHNTLHPTISNILLGIFKITHSYSSSPQNSTNTIHHTTMIFTLDHHSSPNYQNGE